MPRKHKKIIRQERTNNMFLIIAMLWQPNKNLISQMLQSPQKPLNILMLRHTDNQINEMFRNSIALGGKTTFGQST